MYENGLVAPLGRYSALPACGVLAVAYAAEVPFQNAWNVIASKYNKRKTWKGSTQGFERSWALSKLGVQVEVMYDVQKLQLSLLDFTLWASRFHKDATFMVCTPGHVLTVRNQQVADQSGIKNVSASAFKRSTVDMAWKILSNNPKKAVDVKPAISYAIVTNKTERNSQMSKIDQAKAIYAANHTLSRKDMIALFVAQLGLTPAAASTYQNTAKKAYEASKNNQEAAPVVTETEKTELKEAAEKNVKKPAPVREEKLLHDFSKEEMMEVLSPESKAEMERIENMTQDAREASTISN